MVSVISAIIILIAGAIVENRFIKKQFDELNYSFSILYEKIDDETATEKDVYAVKEQWLNKKKSLHAFIPHNEIKEIDLWLFETAVLVRDKEWTEALSKVDVLISLSKEIPKTFSLSVENIF